MQKMCLRCRSESDEKEIDLDQYMFGAGSTSVLPGSGQSGIEGWTAAVVYGGAAGTFSVYGILRDDDEDRSCRRDRTSSLSVFTSSAWSVRKWLLCHGGWISVGLSAGRKDGGGSSSG